MGDNQKKVIIGALVAIAVVLMVAFLHVGSSDPNYGAGYPFLTFGDYPDLWSVFAYSVVPMEEALFLGIIVPILLLAAGGYSTLDQIARIRAERISPH